MTTTVRTKRAPGKTHVLLAADNGVPALSPAVVMELRAIVATAVDDGNALIFRSQERVFCAGIDMTNADDETDAGLLSRFVQIEQLLSEVRSAGVPTVAVVDGAAVGAGADLVAACDVRVGTQQASLRFPGYGFGILLGTGRLTRLVGAKHAMRLVGTAAKASAEEAADMGLLDEVVAGDEIDALAAALGRTYVSPAVDRTLLRVLHELELEAAHDDLARLVRSGSIPGLRNRFMAHREKSRRTRS